MNTILILHGWGSCAKNWDKVKESLESQGNYEVFVPDLPGFGKNPPPKKPWSLGDYTEWLKEFCEKNNLSQIFLLGHSFGGSLTVNFILKYPEKVKKLLLVSPAIVRKKTLKKEIIKKIAKIFSFLPGIVKKTIYERIIKSDYLLISEKVMKKTYLKIIKEDVSSSLSKIKIPTLIVWGDKDKITPTKNAYFINQKIKNSNLKIIQNCSHAPNLECPEKLVKIILSFF